MLASQDIYRDHSAPNTSVSHQTLESLPAFMGHSGSKSLSQDQLRHVYAGHSSEEKRKYPSIQTVLNASIKPSSSQNPTNHGDREHHQHHENNDSHESYIKDESEKNSSNSYLDVEYDSAHHQNSTPSAHNHISSIHTVLRQNSTQNSIQNSIQNVLNQDPIPTVLDTSIQNVLKASMSFSPTDRAGLFLSPVMSQDSQDSSALSASSITENYTLKDPSVNLTHTQNFSPLLSLPMEILHQIIEIVYYDENSASIPANLEKFSKTIPVLSKPFNQLAIRFLYKYAIFNRPNSFERFLSNIIKQPDIGQYVEFMDFQTFTSIGLGRTGRMNQEIQMVTSATIQLALSLCPNLIEFQASENIQDDMDSSVLSKLFNCMPKIQALDFCGASSKQFAQAFDELEIDPNSDSLNHLFKISFHDCSNLPLRVFEKLLPHFCYLRRLDLTHTSITSSVLLHQLPESCRLTHLSLARCSKLTTKDLIQFLTQHSAVCNDSLEWLNLQIDSNVVSPLSDQYLLFTINNLKAPNLRYLNVGGMPVNKQVISVIKSRFPRLESLAIPHSKIDMADLLHLLHENDTLRFLDITNCKGLDRRNLSSFLKKSFGSGLLAIEFDYKTLYDLTSGEHFTIQPVQTDFSIHSTSYLPVIWKFFDNEGRRAWIYKIESTDESYNTLISGKPGKNAGVSNMVYYDLETGAKMETKVAKPDFLRFASRKINCSIGYFNMNTTKKKKYLQGELSESVWPVEFSQRGIYNYYSLNVK